MSLWVDIINPSHALFFNSILRGLDTEGLQITIRDRAETVDLTKLLGLDGRVVGSDHTNRMRKTLGMVSRTCILMATLDKFDHALSFENGMSVLVSMMRRKKSILLCDNDLKLHKKGSNIQELETLIKDHADKLIVPEACIESFSKHVKREKISSFDGYKEDVYIADYLPDPHFKEKLPFDRYVVLRPEALASFYVQESKTLVPSILKNLKNAGINVVYLPRDKGDAKYAAGLDAYIPEKALNGLDLCYHSMGVLTGSGTMAREAACMGKTAISFFPGKTLLSVDEKLIEEGKMIHTRDPKAIVEHVISNIKPTQCIKLERCRNVKENVIRIIKESCHE